MRGLAILCLLAFLPLSAGHGAELNWQNHDAIHAAMEARIVSDFRQRGEEFSAATVPLDARLRLAECGSPLEAFLPPGRRLGGLATVGVRCPGPRPWTVYGKVRVDAFRTVVVTDRPVSVGSVLVPEDIRLERRSLADLPANYLTDPARAIGQAIRRPLPAGSVLGAEQLTAPKLIRRGQKVTIRAAAGGFEVRMSGEALLDGEAGSRIRVRNDQTAKVVEGTVTGPGMISVGL